ncbi:unnamed protein product [Hapterophycus canaliculatus]
MWKEGFTRTVCRERFCVHSAAGFLGIYGTKYDELDFGFHVGVFWIAEIGRLHTAHAGFTCFGSSGARTCSRQLGPIPSAHETTRDTQPHSEIIVDGHQIFLCTHS